MRQVIALLAGLALVIPWAAHGSAATPGQTGVERPSSWRWIESRRFRVYFEPGLDSLARRVLALAGMSDAFLTRSLGHALAGRVPVVLYRSEDELRQAAAPLAMIERGTGISTERFGDRVTLPFTGSYGELRHLLVHQLTHVFLSDRVRHGRARRVPGLPMRSPFPPWFEEGLAEVLATGREPATGMILRDAAVQDGLPRLAASSGVMIGEEGASAVRRLVERFGAGRVRELITRVGQGRGFERSFRDVMGEPLKTFDDEWRTWLRRDVWPRLADRDPAHAARRLTDHLVDGSELNAAPSIAPQGDRVAYISDRRRTTDVHVMSLRTGHVLRRVLRGVRRPERESGPVVRGAVAWSPEGGRLALVLKRGGRDVLGVVDAGTGHVLRRFDLGCDALADPAWSPRSDTLVVTGIRAGRADLWLVDARTGAARRLMDDDWDDREPCWTPDGRTITFVSDRPVSAASTPWTNATGFGRYGLFDLGLASRTVTPLVVTAEDAHWPAWSPDGRRLAFVTDRGGAPNIVLYDGATRRLTQLTDVIGGVAGLSWSREDDRIVFGAIDRGGFDVFALPEPVSVDAVLARFEREQALRRGGPVERERRDDDAGDAAPPTPAPFAGVTHMAAPASAPAPFDAVADSLARASIDAAADSSFVLDGAGAFSATNDSMSAPRAGPYRAGLAPDYAGAGVVAGTGIGFGGSAALGFGDFFREWQISMAADALGRTLDDVDAIVTFDLLRRRWDLHLGLFRLREVHASGVGTAAQTLDSPRVFATSAAGAAAGVAFRLDRHRRLELGYTQMFVRRPAVSGAARDYASVTSPAVALVGDDVIRGSTGPVSGTRYDVSFAPSLGWFGHGLAYRMLTLDARRYWDLARGYCVATRLLAGRNDGADAPRFEAGGLSVLRGVPAYGLRGRRLAVVNAEIRFPFVERLGVVGPIPFGKLDLRGAIFGDLGLAWNRGDALRFSEVVDGRRRLASPQASFGAGARTRIASLVLKLDAVWRTNLAEVGRPVWEFGIGPEF
jgi:hypothetical protein